MKFVHVIAAVTPDPAALPAYRDWVRDYFQALHPLSAGGAYVNFLMEDEGEERVAPRTAVTMSVWRRSRRSTIPITCFTLTRILSRKSSRGSGGGRASR